MIDCKYSHFNAILIQTKGIEGTKNSRLNEPVSNLCEVDYRIILLSQSDIKP